MTDQDVQALSTRMALVEQGLSDLKRHLTSTEAARAARAASRVKLVAWLVGVFIALPSTIEGVVTLYRAVQGNPVSVTQTATTPSHP